MNTSVMPYMPMVDFLADFLGPNAEIVLHDFSDLEHSVIKIRNEHVSGRSVNAPASDYVIRKLKRAKADDMYECNYKGISAHNTELKCASYFIRDDNGCIVGMLCINLDVSDYARLRSYCDSIFLNFNGRNEPSSDSCHEVENFGKTVKEMISQAFDKIAQKYDLDSHLSKKKKKNIINELNEEGIFLWKGTIPKTARFLNISESTVYRYLGELKIKDEVF